jgi:hypothetical protein
MSAFNKFLQFCFAFALVFLAACSTYTDTCDPKLGITAGCEDTATDTQPEADTDSDTDADTDADSDTDSDTDTDTDSDSDTDTDTGNVDPIAASRECWEDVPFQIKDYYFDSSARFTWLGMDETLEWVDIDLVQRIDASEDPVPTTIYSSNDCGGAVEAVIDLPFDFVMPDLGDLYSNGLAVIFQDKGTIIEINYFASCGDGTYHGWVMPDISPKDACDLGVDTVNWLGGHGGSHITATQALQLGELTGGVPIDRPLPIELPHALLYYSADESDGMLGYRGPFAASADSYATSLYTGTNQYMQNGSALKLCEELNEDGECVVPFDCASEMLTEPGLRLCEVGVDHFFFQVDDPWGPHDTTFPITDEALEEATDVFGFDLFLAEPDGDYFADVQNIRDHLIVSIDQETTLHK